MGNFDITIVATRRPEILDRMLKSFTKHLNLPRDYNVYINVDPVGFDIDSIDVVNVVKNYFDNVSYNFPATPNFTKALKWVWSQVKNRLFLNLEDDWKLTRDIDLSVLEKFFINEPRLAQVCFRQDLMGFQFRYNGFYHIMQSFCGQPSILTKQFVNDAIPLLSDNLNVEKQLKNEQGLYRLNTLKKYIYGQWCNNCSNKKPHFILSNMTDIGREWREKYGFEKDGYRDKFTTWVKNENKFL